MIKISNDLSDHKVNGQRALVKSLRPESKYRKLVRLIHCKIFSHDWVELDAIDKTYCAKCHKCK